jgi:hypothetical protein
MSESIKVILKQKSIPVVIDFCLEERIEVNVRPQAFPDNDWELDLIVKDIKTAVMTGMFLRDNRIEIAGTDQQKSKKPVVKKTREEEEKNKSAASDEPKPAENDEKALF